MPVYNFSCENNHVQEMQMTFAEHAALPSDEGGTKYVDCNVKYGDKAQPVCPHHAYQTFGKVGLVGLETAPNG